MTGRGGEDHQEDLARRLESLEALRRFGDDVRTLMADAPAGGRLRLLAERLAWYLDCPVVLQNANLLVVAHSGDDAPQVALAPARHQSVRDVVTPLAGAERAVELPPAGSAPRRLVAPVRARGDLVGFLTAAGEAELDRAGEAMAIVAGWIAFEDVLRSEAEHDRAYDRDAFLFDLAAGNASQRLPERARRMGFDLGRSYIPCVFAVLPPGAESAGKLRGVVLDGVRGACPSGADFLVGVLDDTVVGVVPEDLPAGAGALCESVVKMANDISLRVGAGIGPVCREAADYEAGLRRARWVTEVLTLVSPDGTWAAFEDLGIYALLFDRQRSGELDEFVHRWVGPLVAYDELHNTDLVMTLRCVLDTGGVMTEAAKQLYIHISTLKYRVSRIEDLLAVELRNADLAFNLHLACKILAVRQRLAGAG
ncbi:MAG: PucR family transcriptional regulator [Acidimicrobiia bacterium]